MAFNPIMKGFQPQYPPAPKTPPKPVAQPAPHAAHADTVGRCSKCGHASCTCRGGACKSHADGHSCQGCDKCGGGHGHSGCEMTSELNERYTREPIIRKDLEKKGPAAGKALTASELGLAPGTFDKDPRYRYAYTQWVILREGGADGEPKLYLCLVKPGQHTSGNLKDFLDRYSGSELRVQAGYDRATDSALVLVTEKVGRQLDGKGFKVIPIEEYA